MTESLRQKQSRFVRSVSALLIFAEANGYELTFGDAYRDPRAFGEQGKPANFPNKYGETYSAHKNRLAIDLNLFKDGKWLARTTDFKLLGEYWESLGEDYRWGGRWNDGNHFSLTHASLS